jgi:GH15 family glucan-1,4-alpha-glucosidase
MRRRGHRRGSDTSLSEAVAGVRSWGCRFVWLRDPALTCALFTPGYRSEAHAFMDWVKRTVAGRAIEL